MSQQTPTTRVLFSRRSIPALLVLFGVFSLLLLNFRSPHLAQAATSNTINFQARLETSSGAIAPDGNYNVEFKLYSAASGGTALWTEDYLNNASQGVRVANGYLSVSLGSITAFPNTIAWDQQLWITMNIGGTNATCTPFTSCTPDGEMSPRLQLTAVPYAFSAGQLVDNTGTYYSALGFNTPTQNNNIFLPNESGVICIQSSANCGFLTGSGAGVQLQGSTPGTAQTGYFNISGTGIAGALQAASLDTASAGTLTIGSTNATSITISQNTTLAAGKSITITGGATATRPASPTEGMLYYDTTTHSLLVYSNGKWQADRSTATKIVASGGFSGCTGTSPVASSNSDAADFVTNSCTSAQTAINNAIAALPSGGGTVYLMEGTYIIDGTINLPGNVTLSGAGPATIIKLKDGINANINAITNSVNSTSGLTASIANLTLDGNKANNTSGTQYGVAITTATNSTNFNFSNISVSNFLSKGINANASVAKLTITNSTISNNGGFGLDIRSGTIAFNNLTVTGNSSAGINSSAGGMIASSDIESNAADGIDMYNTATTPFTITNNYIKNNTGAGLEVYAVNNNVVTGNYIAGNTTRGIYVTQSTSNTITGNTIVSGGSSGIFLAGSADKNTISGNKFSITAGDGITIGSLPYSPSYNNITSNNFDLTGSLYGINVNYSGVTGTYLANNNFNGSTSPLRDTGTGTIYANQQDANGNLINKSAGGGFTIGTSTINGTLSLQGGITAAALSSPAAPSLATAGTAGTTSYTYAVTALDGTGETLASTTTTIATGNATLSGTNYIKVTFSPVAGATSYKVYRTASGGSPATTGYISTVTSTGATSYTFNDTGLAASSGTPAANTTGGGTFAGALQAASGTLTSGTLTLGTAGTSTGNIKLYSASGSGSVTLTLTNPGTTNYTLSIPTLTGNDTICTVGAANCTGGSGSGVTSIGTYNSQTANANGAVISGTTLFLQSASGSTPGLIDGTNQSFAGNKTFTGSVLGSTFDTASATALNIGTTSATNVYIGNSSGGINLNGNTTNVNNANFVVGGTSSAVSKVSISGAVNSTSTNLQYGLNNQVNFNPQGASISVIYALNNIATISGSSLSVPTFIGTNTSVATASGFTGTVADARGLNIGGPTIGGSNLFTAYTGINISSNSANGGNTTGTITNTQLNISSTTAGAGTGGTVNNYGINITQPAGTGGTTNNYGLYIQGNGAGSINYSIYNASTALSYFAGGITSAGTLQGGTVNATSGYQYNSTNGSTTTCSGGQFLQNQVVQGGISTGGTCAGAVTTVGTFSATSIANGASISGNTITFGPADGTNPGMVTTGNQSFAGTKTFTGGATVATTSSSAFQIQNTGGSTTLLTADTSNMRISIGSIGTPTGQLYVSGSVPSAAAGSVATGTGPQSVVIQGRYAYVVNSTARTLQIFDVSNPASPTSVGSVATGTAPYDLAVQGRYAYILNSSSNSLQIFDVSNPASPTSVGSVTTGTTPYSVTVQGRYAYVVSDNSNSLQIFDVSNPASPTVVGAATTDTGPQSVTVQGRYAYVVNYNSNSLQTFDVSNPASPTVVGVSSATGTGPTSVTVQGRYAYVVNSTAHTLQTFDISNAGRLVASTGSVGTGTGPTSVTVQGRYAYLVDNTSNSLQIFDVSNPASPTNIGNVTTGTGPTSVTVQGRYAYVVNSTGNTLQTFDLGGTYTQSLEAGSFDASNVAIQQTLTVNQSASVIGGLQAGSLEVNGNAGVQGNLGINGSLVLYNSTNANTVMLQSGTTSTSYAITLPTAIGTAGQCLAVSSVAGSTANLGFSSCGGGGSGHAKKIVLTPEYAGAVLDGSSDTGCTATNGTMTSGFDTGLTGFGNTTQSYYKWQNGVIGNQCYDIVVQVPVPSDFSSWASTTPITINTNTTDTTNGLINLDARDTSGTAESGCSYVSVTPASTNTWTTLGSNCTLAGTYAAGGYMTLRVRVTAPNGGSVKVGNIVLNYNSSY